MKEFITNSPAETQALAKKIAEKLPGGKVLGLVGGLAAGKTVFVQGLAEALGVGEIVNSPTFVLMKQYRVTGCRSSVKHLVHVDAYRLNSSKELKDIGLEEYFNINDTAVIIEWADKVKDLLPKNSLIIEFKEGEHENQRKIIIG